jgi:septal ring factor EnvC (AmiA/AmiB activator)
MSKNFYIKSDGNGGVNVSKVLLAIMILIAFVTPIVTVAVTAQSMKSDISTLKQEYADAGPRHTTTIKEMKSTDKELQIKEAILETKLDQLQKDISEIKADTKDIKSVINK